MSLRTKLLAAIVVLPGAILLVALVLFMSTDPMTPPEAVSAVIHLTSTRNRLELGTPMLQQAKSGHFDRLYVVVTASKEWPEDYPAEVWTVPVYYAEEDAAIPAERPEYADVVDPEERRLVLEKFEKAARLSPPWMLETEYAAVKADGPARESGRSYGIVMKLHTARSAAQTVYWVMVIGILVNMVVSFWLVSRLVIRPLDDLSTAADRIADGDYRVQLEPRDPHDEFGRTVRALDRMAREIAEYQGHLEDRVLTALSRIKKAEQHLTIAQRLAATGKLASGLAHEINNPLGGMKNAVRALARGDLDEEKTALYLDLVADGLSRVEQMVKKFLSFTPRRAEPRPTDMAEVAQKSVALAMHRLEKKHMHVETTFPVPGHAIVFGDPHELQQVALNLVLNAADAIPQGSEGLIQIEVERLGEEVLLRVRDDGAGMSEEAQAHCFDMFFTTKEVGEGSGMGLAVAHNVVSNHGGRIEVVSAEGAGTTFEVYLPADVRPGIEPGSEAPTPAPAAGPAPEEAPQA